MTLRAEPEMAGKVTQCPGCGTRLHIPEAAPDTKTPAAGSSGSRTTGARTRRPRPASSGRKAGKPMVDADPSNVNAWIGLGFGLIGMAAVVFILFAIRNTFVGQVFFTGGWVAWLELLLFFWGLGILFLKTKKTARQRSALLLDILPEQISTEITPDNVDDFIQHLDGMPAMARDSLMVDRIRKGLEMFATRENNSEVASLLSAQSDIDANRVAGSYALLKVFLWAIPILGFIGTVLGLSSAMAAFGAADMSDMEALRDSVSGITEGLSTAFNTTLLGLILAIILIFPMSAMQKREEDCLTEIDTFCNDNLLLRLQGGSTSGGASRSEFSGEAIEALLAQMRETSAHLGRLGSELTDVTRQHIAAIEKNMEETTEKITDRTATALEKSMFTTNKYFEGLERGIFSLNQLLGELGGEKVVVQQAPKKSWWKRG